MDFTTLITILEKELTLYKSLYEITIQKTDIVKKGDVQALNQLMTNEQKHVTSITALEKQRITELNKIFPERKENLPTISECIQVAQGNDPAMGMDDAFGRPGGARSVDDERGIVRGRVGGGDRFGGIAEQGGEFHFTRLRTDADDVIEETLGALFAHGVRTRRFGEN